jgi:hypothetical protein
MTTDTVRRTDPARSFTERGNSETAETMLRDILSTPRVDVHRSGRRRLLIGGAVAGAAAAAAVVVPLTWPGGSGPSTAAYAVERQQDGSVDVSIDFDQFRNPEALQRSLEAQHVRAVVFAGPDRSVDSDPDGTLYPNYHRPACSRYRSLGGTPDSKPWDTDQPVSYKKTPRWEDLTLRLRPDLLPANGTFVILISRDGDRITGLGGDVALGQAPTCAP